MNNLTIIKNFGVLYRTFLFYLSTSISSKDISFSDSIFLVNIGESEGISQEKIANTLAIDKAAIARSVKSMEVKGYVWTKKSATDNRAKALYLSDTGRELFHYLLKIQEEWLEQVLGELDSNEKAAFAQTINDLSTRAKNIRVNL